MTAELFGLAPGEAFRRNLRVGLAVHAVACAVFIGLSSLRLEGCDRSDGLAAAWGIAIAFDLLVGGTLYAIAIQRSKGRRVSVSMGWLVSSAPLIVLAVLAIAYVNSLPSGCG